MIVSCSFRDPYKSDFINGPYAFECDIEVEVGDLVLVETKFGISLAQVHKINTTAPEHVMALYGQLKKVLEKCQTKCYLPTPIIRRGYEENE